MKVTDDDRALARHLHGKSIDDYLRHRQAAAWDRIAAALADAREAGVQEGIRGSKANVGAYIGDLQFRLGDVTATATTLLAMLDEHCGPQPAWSAEMEALRGALATNGHIPPRD